MYKKYMHSGDRKTNPTPVNEGLISWAKGKIDNYKKEKEEKKRLDKEKKAAEREAALKELIEKNKKLFKVMPKQAFLKIQGFVKEALKDKQFSEFKNAKALPTDYHKRFNDSYFNRMVDDFFDLKLSKYRLNDFELPIYAISLPVARSEQQVDFYEDLCDKLRTKVAEKIDKMDKVYTIYIYDIDDNPDELYGYYYESGKTTVLVSIGVIVPDNF